MLARGMLARLASEVPKTSTHNLSRVHLLQRRLFSNGLRAVSAGAGARVYNALLGYGKSYATAAATKPAPKAKKVVKKPAAKKPAAKKPAAKPAAKKAAPKKKPVKKVAKKKAVPKKAAKPKPKSKPRVKKTPEQLEKIKIKATKEHALSPPLLPGAVTAWNVFFSETLTGNHDRDPGTALKAASVKFKALTPAEKEHYNHLGNERTAAKRAEFEKWVRTHTPEQIRQANLARAWLRKKLTAPSARRRYVPLVDDRLLKMPASPYLRFSNERRATGDFKAIKVIEAVKLIAAEWKVLSDAEKKKYLDAYQAQRVEYEKKYLKTYGHAPGRKAAA
ncbi:hypothetical protein P280DRAFT_471825 [Massarina eburnea CBS 473.64]|uniref:HMG box domain-containing protein n=1 Tax=Massarina eburnea CBS 473.64 TaxID=1395130 RepID=A0A6A6RRA3_9PLEO|nr:hypothetical protein P280DRAFT_471825 [Massarina eburnea CBS 473.64]